MNNHCRKTNWQDLRARRKRCRRKGLAATECAICIPVILMFTFATIEFTSAIFLKETLTVAAYEGARVAVQRKAEKKHAKDQVKEILEARGIKKGKITISPNKFKDLKALDVVTIEVSAPLRKNSFFIGRFLTGQSVTAVVKMRREYDE